MTTATTLLGVLTTFVLVGAAPIASATERSQLDGAQLFTYHACVNCHGEQGKHPKSKIVPKLAGKPADKLFNRVTKILAGEDLTDESMLMHAAIGYHQSCDAPPSEAELRAITQWLAAQ